MTPAATGARSATAISTNGFGDSSSSEPPPNIVANIARLASIEIPVATAATIDPMITMLHVCHFVGDDPRAVRHDPMR